MSLCWGRKVKEFLKVWLIIEESWRKQKKKGTLFRNKSKKNTDSLRLEKTSKTIESNLWLIATFSTRAEPWVLCPVVPWTPPGMDSTPGSLHVLSMKTALSRECSIIENKLAWTVEGKNVFKRRAGELLASLTPVFHKMSRYSEQCVVHNGSFQAHGVVFVLSLKFRVDHECFRLSF